MVAKTIRSASPWRGFFLGVVIGLIIGAVVTGMVLGRYKVTTAGPLGIITVRLDRLTGKMESWKFWQGQWQEVEMRGEEK